MHDVKKFTPAYKSLLKKLTSVVYTRIPISFICAVTARLTEI